MDCSGTYESTRGVKVGTALSKVAGVGLFGRGAKVETPTVAVRRPRTPVRVPRGTYVEGTHKVGERRRGRDMVVVGHPLTVSETSEGLGLKQGTPDQNRSPAGEGTGAGTLRGSERVPFDTRMF